MKKSLQRIEDFYMSQGYNVNGLRKILSKDKDYQKLLKEKKTEIDQKMSLTKIRYLPKTFITLTVMNIYNDRITLYSVTEENIPFIILIENKELSRSFKEYFEWLWKLSK